MPHKNINHFLHTPLHTILEDKHELVGYNLQVASVRTNLL